jgi:hypothetical protein
MPGNYKSLVVFPFSFPGSKSSRIQIEPFACVYCYGVSVKLILELTGGSGINKFVYERTIFDECITQEDITDGFMEVPFIEAIEGFYFNRVETNILIPVCAMLLKIYFSEVLESFNINLDSYIVDVNRVQEDIGFKSRIKNVSDCISTQNNYKGSANTSTGFLTGNVQIQNKSSSKQIIRSFSRKNPQG